MISVLYVDDEPDLLEIGKIYLEEQGDFQVDISTSGSDALERVHINNYDLIISDYMMPVMNGLELIKIIRSSGNEIPFIIFTGRSREEVVIEALNAGVDFYLQKGGEPTAQFAELGHAARSLVQHYHAEMDRRDSEFRYRNMVEIIRGLIDLEIKTLRDPEKIVLLQTIERRMRALSLIHETLCKCTDHWNIDISRYLQDLVSQLRTSYTGPPDQISVTLKIPPLQLDIESAAACGLIISELFSNSLQHAFPDGMSGQICISLQLYNRTYTLTYSDNGVGMPDGLTVESTDTLGLKLINLLATDQLDGSICLLRDEGTEFIITFPQQHH